MQAVSVTAHDPQSVLAAIEGADRFLVQQVFKPIANEYRISIPTPGSTEGGEPLLFVKQKRMKIKEDIRFRLSPDDGRQIPWNPSQPAITSQRSSCSAPSWR